MRFDALSVTMDDFPSLSISQLSFFSHDCCDRTRLECIVIFLLAVASFSFFLLLLLLLIIPRYSHFRHFTHLRYIHLNLFIQFIVINWCIINVCEHSIHLIIQSRKYILRLLKFLLSTLKFLQRITLVLQYLPHLSKSLVYRVMKNSAFNSAIILGWLSTQISFSFTWNNWLNNLVLLQYLLFTWI